MAINVRDKCDSKVKRDRALPRRTGDNHNPIYDESLWNDEVLTATADKFHLTKSQVMRLFNIYSKHIAASLINLRHNSPLFQQVNSYKIPFLGRFDFEWEVLVADLIKQGLIKRGDYEGLDLHPRNRSNSTHRLFASDKLLRVYEEEKEKIRGSLKNSVNIYRNKVTFK